MVRISHLVKTQIEEMGLLKIEEGRYKDLVVVNKHHKSKKKTFFISEETYKVYQRRIKNQSNQ